LEIVREWRLLTSSQWRSRSSRIRYQKSHLRSSTYQSSSTPETTTTSRTL